MMQRCLDAAFDAGVLPREDTPRDREIRQVPLQTIAGEITAGLVSMAERGWAGNEAQKGTQARSRPGGRTLSMS